MIGPQSDQVKKPIYAYVATLGYSRYTFAYFTNNMEADTLIVCHERSFLFFNGTTKVILYDNMKTVVDKRNHYGDNLHKYHPKLLDLFKKYGFKIRLCKPYRAKTKGKVERFNSYKSANNNDNSTNMRDTKQDIKLGLIDGAIKGKCEILKVAGQLTDKQFDNYVLRILATLTINEQFYVLAHMDLALIVPKIDEPNPAFASLVYKIIKNILLEGPRNT